MSSTKKQKTSNTNNSTQDNFNYEQSSNNNLTTVSNKTHDKNITFDNLNYKHTPMLQHKNFKLIEQQKIINHHNNSL